MDSRSVAPSQWMNPMKEERGVTFNNNFQIFISRGLGVPGVLGSRFLSPHSSFQVPVPGGHTEPSPVPRSLLILYSTTKKGEIDPIDTKLSLFYFSWKIIVSLFTAIWWNFLSVSFKFWNRIWRINGNAFFHSYPIIKEVNRVIRKIRSIPHHGPQLRYRNAAWLCEKSDS